MRVKINEREAIRDINEAKSWLFKKINNFLNVFLINGSIEIEDLIY